MRKAIHIATLGTICWVKTTGAPLPRLEERHANGHVAVENTEDGELILISSERDAQRRGQSRGGRHVLLTSADLASKQNHDRLSKATPRSNVNAKADADFLQASAQSNPVIADAAVISNTVVENYSDAPHGTKVLVGNALLLGFCIILLLCFSLGPIGYSIVAMLLWGIDLFVLSYANVLFPHPVMLLMGKFAATGVEGIILHHYFGQQDSKYQTEPAPTTSMGSYERAIFFVGPGLALISADVFAVMGFGLDLTASGVHGVIVLLNPVMVSLFFYFRTREAPSRWQLIGGMLGLGGGFMTCAVGAYNHISASKELGVVYCFVSMLGYTILIILLRLSSIKGISWKRSWVGRCLALGFGGMLTFGMYPLFFKALPAISWDLIMWSCIITASDELGLYAVVKSFEFPGVVSGVNSAIAASCSLVNILLGITLLGYQQPMLKYVAAGISFVGTTILALG